MATPHARRQLLEQLREIAERGLTHETLRDYPQITNLPALRATVGASGSEGDRIRRFADVLRGGLDRLALDEDDHRPDAIIKYFGLQAGMTRSGFARRRRSAANALHVSEPSFRDKRLKHGSHEQRLLDTVLDIFDAEPDTETPETSPRARVHPSQSALELQWRYRFEHYSGISTRLRESAAYIEAYLNLRSEAAPPEDYDGYALASLWAYAKFGRTYQKFIDELGGGWAFSTSQVEVDAAEAIRICTLVSPHSWEDDSYVRVQLGRAEDEELAPFGDWIRSDDRGALLLDTWREWIESCVCSPPQPHDECRPHTLIQNAEAFLTIVHTEWPRIADWYTEPAANWRLDPAELAKRLRPPSNPAPKLDEPDGGNPQRPPTR